MSNPSNPAGGSPGTGAGGSTTPGGAGSKGGTKPAAPDGPKRPK